MPELPEVETVCRGLAPFLEGRRLVHVEQRRPDLRWPFPADFTQRLTGQRIIALRRRAKYILAELEDGTVLIVHLGMSGRLLITQGRPAELEKHDHVVLATEEDVWIRFNDARRFGAMDLATLETLDGHRMLAGLGPEPLSNAFSGPILAASLAGKRTPIKAALLDQRVVAGIGNIYACEALYRAGISPRRLAASVQGIRAERLALAVKQVLAEAIAAGGSTLRDYRQADGELGYFQHSFQVYDREGLACVTPECGRPLLRLVQSGRSTFYCARCQR
ncbi:MAG: bifunctional DNA-formamidopyrimidine glycosylase/DNA-(apurinic or apyrimidinic site) lyase [Alphaproteobacteria bacterium]|nr:bifunctional DNA-formamidopyrimidine glycosylase/DNA-(apurinic or apyrimidinic site) lyase [Alphaproteobacteria bacterium]MBU0798296.1 bifunctional DNA-formamidopyrimidine glycosylase/DNA-(apurinic or apyrimidinic site) lyase [Alphaproteobacteria bacterium]MBU0886409.1 bifunctional DNA-formamidopyrimidine glycosylase/DNA-(apurinic or apyrimidinic site) lyase [Alphaproteobacteria bacterium]MBU1813395.1 bifunctional DNA-formamidopyrimidine glycosylase/DNA-(apurinic or apyrimidinic site) lyase [